MACCNNRCGNRCNRCNCGRGTQSECTIRPVSGCPTGSAAADCEWYPIEVTQEDIPMRMCCDQDGTCGMYPEACRNTFWPDFSHPRWLCCKDLYCARRRGC